VLAINVNPAVSRTFHISCCRSFIIALTGWTHDDPTELEIIVFRSGKETSMRERVKVFTYVSGTGATVVETPLEDHINEWLESVDARLLNVSQSESERNGTAHVTVCAWYLPESASRPA